VPPDDPSALSIGLAAAQDTAAPLGSGPTELFDPAVAHCARIYDYWLGGKDHFDADRIVAEEVIRMRPQVAASARANRGFLARVVRYLGADCGIRQFLDIGVGLPAADPTHEVAQAAAPDARIVYVDNDRVVLSHARALLVKTSPQGTCAYVEADLHDPKTILAQAAQTLDFTQPTAILLLAVLHFIADTAAPDEIVAALASALAPGSYLAISHLTADFAPEQVTAAAAAYNEQASAPVTPRTHAQVSGLFGGLPLVAPGVVPVTGWRPPVAGLPHRMTADLYAGLARVPGGHPVTAPGGGQAALEHLAAALGPGFITTLVTGAGHQPRLSVVSRDGCAAQDVYADDSGWFWWPWAERIAATTDPLTAAYQVTAALHGSTPVRGPQ
jgi:SAM-dependent methyltransferase